MLSELTIPSSFQTILCRERKRDVSAMSAIIASMAAETAVSFGLEDSFSLVVRVVWRLNNSNIFRGSLV